MKGRYRLFPLFAFLVLMIGCKENTASHFNKPSVTDFQELISIDYKISNYKIRYLIDSIRFHTKSKNYIDLATNIYYAERKPYLWISRLGASNKCDTVIPYIEKIIKTGFRDKTFHLSTIKKDIERIRTLNFDKANNPNLVMARFEYYMTKAYMRYSSGQRFGFISPNKFLNNLDSEKIDSATSKYHVLYDISSETPGKKFVHKAITSISNGRLTEFLKQVQPTDSAYYYLERKYLAGEGTESQLNTIFVNMERLRWRSKFAKTGKYVIVNLPEQSLKATDTENNTSLAMKICCGRKANKTPLLNSQIKYAEFNPYWIVPQSIIKKEIAVRHAQDNLYFERNRMRIIDKSTGEEMPPEEVSSEMLSSGKYRIRQEKGDGNSLGRIIFRFPNNFSIYLHDTNNRNVFMQSNRCVSHGCIRVERPLELAIFLLEDKDANLIDRIRIAIDIPPVTDYGKSLLSREGYKHIGYQSFKPVIPLSITYFTACPSTSGETISYYPDIYDYDNEMLKRLKSY